MTRTSRDRIGPGDLGIDLTRGSSGRGSAGLPGSNDMPDDASLFKWLTACLLFGTRISQEIAADAFRALDADGVVTPRKLADADWQHLVDLLGEGHYRRYDESKARELIALGRDVLDRYDGRLSGMLEDAGTKRELTAKLKEFTGIGPVAARIFIREVETAAGSFDGPGSG